MLKDKAHHMSHECPNRLVQCPFCGDWIKFCDCPHVDITCELKCGLMVPWCIHHLHVLNDCPNRPAECCYECGTAGLTVTSVVLHQLRCQKFVCDWCSLGELLEEEIMPHKLNDCPMRPVECDWCGQFPIPHSKLELHKQFECPCEPTECDWCHEQPIKICELHYHKMHLCRWRLIDCDRCGKQNIKFCDLEHHYVTDCLKDPEPEPELEPEPEDVGIDGDISSACSSNCLSADVTIASVVTGDVFG